MDIKGDWKARSDIVAHYRGFAAFLRKNGRTNETENCLRAAVSLLEQQTAEFPDDVASWRNLAGVWAGIGRDYISQQRLKEAEPALRRAIEIRNGIERRFSGETTNEILKAYDELSFASALAGLNKNLEAEEVYRGMLRLRDPKLRGNQYASLFLGVAHYRLGEWQQSIDAYEASMKSRGNNSIELFGLAMANWQLGRKDKAINFFDSAVDWMEKHNALDTNTRSFREEAERLIKKSDQ
jgi:tetratricopeptide (TPR) repeat protein